MSWRVRALVTRYEVPIDTAKRPVLHRGDFERTLVNWWVPIVGSHHGRGWPLGIARGYDDRDDGLIADFVLGDEFVAAHILDGFPVEFSIGWARPVDAPEYVAQHLDHVALLLPPSGVRAPVPTSSTSTRLARSGRRRHSHRDRRRS